MYYLNKAKQAKYAIDEDKVSEYLEINNVLKGIFYVANKLYGLTFRECTDKFPVYEKTAQSWEVIDKDGKVLAFSTATITRVTVKEPEPGVQVSEIRAITVMNEFCQWL